MGLLSDTIYIYVCVCVCVCVCVQGMRVSRQELACWRSHTPGLRVHTSKRWELTFFPFFIQVILGLGSPVAWHTNDATPPEMPVWSSGVLTKVGVPETGKERVDIKREKDRMSAPWSHTAYHVKRVIYGYHLLDNKADNKRVLRSCCCEHPWGDGGRSCQTVRVFTLSFLYTQLG